MGHIVNSERQYRLLQQQLDRTVTGAPPSPTLLKILRLLYPSDDVELAAALPLRLTDVEELARRFTVPAAAIEDRLSAMAQRGLVFDVEHDGRRYFSLAPLALGFFEFTFMRTRGDLPIAELARLFEEYMQESTTGGIYASVFRGPTQIGRTLVDERAIPDDGVEVLDWERASHIVQTASAIGVGLCACRHMASHLGRACDRPQRVCLTFNYAARSVIRNGLAEPITTAEAMAIIERSKEAGLVQIADNVQQRVAYMCNCCGCCCEMFRSAKLGNIRNAITTSNWIMQVDADKCNGCGRCAATCPMDAIELTSEDGEMAMSPRADGSSHGARRARVCPQVCIGCGLCASECSRDAIRMAPRAQRVITPETIVDRMAMMAIERNKLADFLFDRRGRVGHRILGRLVAALERTPLWKAAIAIEPLRSAFLHAVVAAGQEQLSLTEGE
ncbi:MAG: 4Fe-4S dicluster domain-containing protein [Planctomycetaceae bacterium]|nr:4Fe-4S dicluster domain-containing protein [Planctomycetaceae bacterium]